MSRRKRSGRVGALPTKTTTATTLPGAYAHGIGRVFTFIGQHLASATITALTFAFVYKYIVAGEADKTPTASGE